MVHIPKRRVECVYSVHVRSPNYSTLPYRVFHAQYLLYFILLSTIRVGHGMCRVRTMATFSFVTVSHSK